MKSDIETYLSALKFKDFMKSSGLFIFLILLVALSPNFVISQSTINYPYQTEFEIAYEAFPEIPDGLLEAVAYAQTRIEHIQTHAEGCAGLPVVSGVMGLTENGEGYFKNNLLMISALSGISVDEIKNDPQKNIYAYASAYAYQMNLLMQNDEKTNHVDALENNIAKHIQILEILSEIPIDKNKANQFALDCFTYEVFRFLHDPNKQNTYHFPAYQLDFVSIYGEENFEVLSSTTVIINSEIIQSIDGDIYTPQFKSLEYAPAIWVAAPSCNYSSRSGTAISAVTIHTIQGSYAGAISWAQNCDANVSYHYVARSSDGQITQMVYEANKAWHVGSENPYTIGIEHEGYVTNPIWYTEAMYIGSANLVKDICNSGYGINPLRTFQGPATSGINVIGSCTKIKGHQHYPSQTHTDPGIYWNWEHYYQLINDNTTVTTYTASSGTFYDSGGAGSNYSDDERKLYLIQPSGAVTVSISFVSFNIETDWDYMYIYDGSSTTDPVLGVFTGGTLPSNITSTGAEMLIEFRSDCATVSSGWQINWSSVAGPVPGDIIPPSTAVSFSTDWKTVDFISDFTDTDNVGGSGVQYQFYQVIDFDGTEWRANADHGFFSDNFDLTIHPEWTTSTGNWSIVSGYLNQVDETNSNTNIYASLNQDNDQIFLYHWGGKISGTGTNKRAGFHFMCDNPSLPNRGNSYFIWFREDDNKVQIYEVVSDVFTLMADVTYSINANQWYDFKTSYDKNSGTIKVWVNDVFVASWTDTSPLTSGNSVSFRSGNCVYDVNDFKVYHNRASSETVSIGITGDARYQNTNPATASAKIKSISVDSSSNVSAIGWQLANIDWTAPANISQVLDGIPGDITTFSSNTEISANWFISADIHSDIARYWYSIGTSPGLTDIVTWTDNWFDTSMTHTGLSLTYGQMYYVNVRAENGAGLLSDIVSSDGQFLQVPVNPPTANFTLMNTNVCVSDSLQILNSSADATDYLWTAPGAIPSSSTTTNPYFQFPVSGTYEITLIADGPGGTDTEIQLLTIEVLQMPDAQFTQSTDTVSLDYPYVTFSNSSMNSNGYYWDFGDGNSSSDTDPWHGYTAPGTYSVTMIAINGTCPNDTAWSTVTVIETSAIEEHDEESLFIYPNPASDSFIIQWHQNSMQPTQIDMIDSRGRLIFSDQISDETGSKEIDLNQTAIVPGIYLIRISWNDSLVFRKIEIR